MMQHFKIFSRPNSKSAQTYPPIISKLSKFDETKMNLSELTQNEIETQINSSNKLSLNESEINSLINAHYNLIKNLMKIIKRELFTQEDDEV
jgi:hypothetical protein